ncbi:zinc finger protein 740 isoform X2 [Alligator sinensis]|uniref:Zinc finger protein 740 isoform X2 n=1 Tax=Alligator sinensis TaxID=38654 RepID=A0A3Q0H7L1_ALLSI|nr:zinc finger protein 740 isoform X2 [Alligator sinensis]
MAQASLLACEGLSGVCLVPTVASKKMMPKQSSKQAENGERGSSPDMLGLRAESEKPRSRKEEEAAEASQPKKSLKKVVVIEQNGSFQLRIPKNFICEHCYGAFRSSYHLKRHILIHTGEKPFECDVCDMRFIQKYHLERHKRVHSGEKPYQCERCLQARLRGDLASSSRTRYLCPIPGGCSVPGCWGRTTSPPPCSDCTQKLGPGWNQPQAMPWGGWGPPRLPSQPGRAHFSTGSPPWGKQSFSRTDRLLRHKRMCQGCPTKTPDSQLLL